MDQELEIYRSIQEISETNIGSCNVLFIKPRTRIPKHYHKNGIEIEYVYRGDCKTHKKGEIKIWDKNQPHELINDSGEELVVICLKVPPHSEEDVTYYVERSHKNLASPTRNSIKSRKKI